jgi:hypothetical protein
LYQVSVSEVRQRQTFLVEVNGRIVAEKTPRQVKEYCKDARDWVIPALIELGQAVSSQTLAKEICPCLEFILRNQLNDPLQYSQALFDFLDRAHFKNLQALKSALDSG